MGRVRLFIGSSTPEKSGEANILPRTRPSGRVTTPRRPRPSGHGLGRHRKLARERPAAWTTQKPPLRVVVAEPNGLVRLGLSAALRRLENVELVGDAADLDGLVSLLEEHRPGMAVLDLALPGLDEHEDLVAPLRQVVADLKVIVVSDDTTDTAVIRTFRAEADGFVVKREAQQMLPVAVWAVMEDGWFLDPQVAGIIIALVFKGQRNYEGPFGMTVQEQRVAALLAGGLTNREIGAQLGISAGTVKTHVANAVAKLGAHDRYEAAEIAEREGITAPGT